MMLVDDIINIPTTMTTGKQVWLQTQCCLAYFLHYSLLSFSNYYTAFIPLVDLVCSSLLGIAGWLGFLWLRPHSQFTLFWRGKVAWLSDWVGGSVGCQWSLRVSSVTIQRTLSTTCLCVSCLCHYTFIVRCQWITPTTVHMVLKWMYWWWGRCDVMHWLW